MEQPRVIVIGAGLAGLSAAIHARRNGFEVELHEAHNLPGGVCTAWRREGFRIDGCIHWLMDFPALSRLEAEVGLAGVPYLPLETYVQLTGFDGELLSIDRDDPGLEARLQARYPEDAAFIARFFRAARRIGAFGMPLEKPPALQSWWQKLTFTARNLPTLIPLLRMLIPMGEYAEQQVKNPELRQLLNALFNADMPASFSAMIVGQLIAGRLKALDFSRFDSLDFARRMETCFKALGGEVRYSSRIASIKVRDGRVCGVVTAAGEELAAAAVIASGDLHTALHQLLPPECDKRSLLDLFERWQLFKPILQISYGVENWEWPGKGNALGMLLPEPIAIGPDRHTRIGVRAIRQREPQRLVLQADLETEFDYWNDLQQRDPQAYGAEKQRGADELLAALQPLLPGLADHVRMVDVGTPTTFVRYAGVYRGAYEGWIMNREGLIHPPSQTLPAVSGLYFAGQWFVPGGGIQPVIKSGRDAVMLLCHQQGREFVAG